MSEKSHVGWYFLVTVLIIYLVGFILNRSVIFTSLGYALNIFKNIVPIFFLVFGLMTLVNYYSTPQLVAKYIGKSSGAKRWIISVVGGIISTGPIYMWYPMLKELKKRGVSYGFIATFLYNRAIKPPLIPLLIFYFGVKFTFVLSLVMILTSLMEGLIFEKLERGGLI